MKRSISLLSALAFVLVISGSAFAQPDVTASADIVQDLNFTRNSQLNFGQISNSQTADAVLDPQGTNTANVGNTTSFGEIEVTAAAGSSITISFTNPTNIDDGNSNTIGFTPDYSGNTSDAIGSSTDLVEGSSNTVTTDGTSGKFFIYYGGTLAGTDIDGATTGSYTGTISTTIAYE